MTDLSVGTLIAEAFSYFKRRMVFYISMILVYLLVMIAVYLIGEKMGRFGNILARLVEIYINAGVLKVIINDLNGKEPELFDLFTAGDIYLNFLIASILYGLIVGVGTIFFIIPGIILGVMFQFYKYAIVDKKLGIIESLNYSKELTSGYRWTIFGIDVVLILINVAGVLLLGIGLLFTVPLTFIAEALMYKKLTVPIEGIETDDNIHLA